MMVRVKLETGTNGSITGDPMPREQAIEVLNRSYVIYDKQWRTASQVSGEGYRFTLLPA